jgi:hypothetical protein
LELHGLALTSVGISDSFDFFFPGVETGDAVAAVLADACGCFAGELAAVAACFAGLVDDLMVGVPFRSNSSI